MSILCIRYDLIILNVIRFTIFSYLIYDGSGFSISSDDIDVDQNGLAACINRHEAFPTVKLPCSPVNLNDLLNADQIPTLATGLDVHRRLTQIGVDTVDFSRSKRRGTSLIQPNRGRRDSISSTSSTSTIVSDSGSVTAEILKRRPRNSLGLRTMIVTDQKRPSQAVTGGSSKSVSSSGNSTPSSGGSPADRKYINCFLLCNENA